MPKKGRAATPQPLKPQQPRRGELRYKEQYNVLTSELCAQKASLQLEIEQQHQAQERQKVLVDLIICQEELTHLLQYHHSLLQQTSSPAALEATALPPAELKSSNNRFNRVLAAAPAELIKEVISLKHPEDCIRVATEHFKEQVVLLELAGREFLASRSSPRGMAGTTEAAPDAPMEPSTKHIGNLTAAAATQHLAHAAPAGVDDAATGQDKECPSVLQQLEQLVQQGMCLVGLALLHNPIPWYISATCNYLTGQMDVPPPQHVQRVLSRLRLSDLQLLHLRLAIEEFERLSREAHQEGGQLSEQIARLSLQQLVESVAQQQRQEQQMPSEKQEPNIPTQMSASAAAVAAVAAEVATDSIAADDEVRQQLTSHMSRYLGRIDVHNNVTTWFIINTLTLRQVAILIVASFPYAPVVHAVAEAAKQLHKQRQQERLAKIAPRVTSEEVQETTQGADDGSLSPPSAAEQLQQQQDQTQHAQQRTESDAQYDAFDKEVAEYMDRRNVMLQQQVQQWWLDIGALP